AETIRDSLLAFAGELDLKAGGPYVPTNRMPDGTVEVPANKDGARRRSIYLQQRRTQVDTVLQIFDAPAIASTGGKRSPSPVPLQALVMLNSECARSRAKNFAKRLAGDAGPEADKRLSLAFKLVSSRAPSDDERAACEKFLAKQRAAYAAEKDAEERAWAD